MFLYFVKKVKGKLGKEGDKREEELLDKSKKNRLLRPLQHIYCITMYLHCIESVTQSTEEYNKIKKEGFSEYTYKTKIKRRNV